MKDLAAQLGLSRTTVSLVLKGAAGRYRISSTTRDRVLRAARRARYRPNYFARALTMRRTGVIGIVFPNVFETFMSEVIKGMEDVLYPAEYTMMLCTSRFDRELEARNIEQLRYRGVDGFLVVFNAPFRGEPYGYGHLRPLLNDTSRPTVFVDRYPRTKRCHYVVQDDYRGAYDATRGLARMGCRRIGYVSLDIDATSVEARRRGYEAGLRERGLRKSTQNTVLLRTRDSTSEDLAAAIRRMLDGPGRPDGLFVTTNGLAHRVCELVEACGLTLNRDIQIATFGSDPPWFASGMLCVEQPRVEMGARAARLLTQLIEHPRRRRVWKHCVIRPRLVPPSAPARHGRPGGRP
jgi:DNA-binding LacI/PurR family transcriptional regulator